MSEGLLVEVLEGTVFVSGGRRALEHVLENPVVIAIQATRERCSPTPANRTGHDLVVGARVSDHAETDVGPEATLPPESKWCSDDGDDLRHSHRSQERDRPKELPSRLPSCLGDHRLVVCRSGVQIEFEERVFSLRYWYLAFVKRIVNSALEIETSILRNDSEDYDRAFDVGSFGAALVVEASDTLA